MHAPAFAKHDELGQGLKRRATEHSAHQPFPLPPLAEQHRIVAKVDELMGLCDRLEAARAGREAVRDRLAAASLARLNAPDPETFRPTPASPSTRCPPSPRAPTRSSTCARPSSTSPCAASWCRRTPNDEPASELLKRMEPPEGNCLRTLRSDTR